MPTTGAPWNVYYPDNTAPISPIENLFSTLSTSVATALTLFQSQAPYVVAAPSNLDALTTAAVGAIAYMTAPGTGVNAMTWRALSTGSGAGLDWQIEDDVIVADTKAHFDSFVTVLAGLAGTDLQFKVGQLVRTTSDSLIYYITSTAGAYQPFIPYARFKGTITTSKAVGVSNKWGISTGPTFDSTDDPQAGFSSATGLYTCKVAGTYLVMVQAKANTSGFTTAGGLVVQKNGTNAIQGGNDPNAGGFMGLSLFGYLRLAVNDTVSCQFGGAYTSQSDSPADNNFFELVQVGL